MVYFLQSGTSGPIKIGVSGDPERRLKALQTASVLPLTLLAICEGGYREEKAWHRRFRHLAIAGEWFHGVPELLAAIFEAGENSWEAV